jgi:hypothetical protein
MSYGDPPGRDPGVSRGKGVRCTTLHGLTMGQSGEPLVYGRGYSASPETLCVARAFRARTQPHIVDSEVELDLSQPGVFAHHPSLRMCQRMTAERTTAAALTSGQRQ